MGNIVAPDIGELERADVCKLVKRILRDLGNPEPPLKLEDVRDLLRMDLKYYSSTDVSALQEVAHKVWVAGRQLGQFAERSSLLGEVIRKTRLTALWLPEKKRILLDEDEPRLKHRWSEAHEIGHGIIPWHYEFAHGDDAITLSPSCHEQIEAEANYAAGQLLFLQDRFAQELRDVGTNWNSLAKLKKVYGNTLTSTFWRFVEEYDGPEPRLGLICSHPRYLSDADDDAEAVDGPRYLIRSRAFRLQFDCVRPDQVYEACSSYVSYRTKGPLGVAEMLVTDVNGREHVFDFASFSNGYAVFTLGVYRYPKEVQVSVSA